MINLPRACRILHVREDNYRTRTFTLDAQIEAQPGQFVMLWLPRFDEKPFSLVAANPVTVMVTAVGPFTRLLHTLGAGDRVWLRGPFGTGFVLPPSCRAPVLIGGGYGVAPLSWLARAAAGSGHVQSVTTIIGARSADDLLYATAFAADAAHAPGVAVRTLLTTEDGSAGLRGRVTDALLPLLAPDAGQPGAPQRPDALFACGPHAMLHALQQVAARHALPAQLSWEAYMRCAVGVCGACEHEGALLCLDGPVLAGHA